MNAPIPKNPGIIILGMHRSGTSLTAELVQKWGAYGNEATMPPGDTSNPRGYWEPAPLVRFNDELLGMVQSRWTVPPSAEAKSSLSAMAEDPEFRRRALNLLTGIRASGRPWFWKDPRLSILLPFWKQFWGDVLYLIPVRDPGDIAHSLRHRYGFSLGHSLVLWHKYMLDIFQDEQVRSTGVFLGYEDLLAEPRGECERLCRVLDERMGTFASDLTDQDRRLKRMIGAVDPALWRSRADARFLRNPLASEAQRVLYRALLFQSKGESQQCSGDFDLEPQWRQTLLTQDLLQRLGIASAQCQVFWRGSQTEYAEDRSESVRVTMDWTPQRIQIAVPPSQDSGEVGIRIDLADRPALVWLTGMTLRDSAENVVWAWDGCADSLAGFAQNDIGFCRPLKGESGCVLWLDGFDP